MMAKLRSRYANSYAWDALSLRDILVLTFDAMPTFPIQAGRHDRLRTLDECQQAWHETREYFIGHGYQDPDEPKPNDEFFRFEPGRRPWCFWVFDQRSPAVPPDQITALQALRAAPVARS